MHSDFMEVWQRVAISRTLVMQLSVTQTIEAHTIIFIVVIVIVIVIVIIIVIAIIIIVVAIDVAQ